MKILVDQLNDQIQKILDSRPIQTEEVQEATKPSFSTKSGYFRQYLNTFIYTILFFSISNNIQFQLNQKWTVDLSMRKVSKMMTTFQCILTPPIFSPQWERSQPRTGFGNFRGSFFSILISI